MYFFFIQAMYPREETAFLLDPLGETLQKMKRCENTTRWVVEYGLYISLLNENLLNENHLMYGWSAFCTDTPHQQIKVFALNTKHTYSQIPSYRKCIYKLVQYKEGFL